MRNSAIRWSLAAALLMLFALPLYAAGKGKAIEPFNGKDLSGWRTAGGDPQTTLKVGTARLDPNDPARLVVEPGGSDLVNPTAHAKDFFTEQKFGDGVYEIEFMVPKGSNSGVYIMGEYEIQILDSFGKTEVGPGDVGGLYGAQAPKVNAAKAPGEWQKFVVDFRAPKFDASGKKTANARFVRVTLNGKVIHENVEMKQQTPGGVTGKEHAEGPLMFQGNHGPVAFRNIKIRPPK
ncbi:MAG: 3-keto-disaccharide hydrolase [Thermoguttaceae bacterium]|jgi:hypothetical protein